MERPVRRRAVLHTALAGLTSGLTGCQLQIGAQRASTATRPTPTERTNSSGVHRQAALPTSIDLEAVTTAVSMPVAIAFAPTHGYRYIATNPGRIFVHGTDGLLDDPLLDLRDRIASGYEMGLLGMVLHPAFPDDPRLFVRYSASPRAGTPPGYNHTFVLASFDLDAGGRQVVTGSETTVMEIPQPHAAHNAGDLAFGPEGYLYVPTGDGGGFGDTGPGHSEDWYSANGGGNGQNTREQLLGGVLRIDVDATPTEHPRTDEAAPASPRGRGGYTIPRDNPLVGVDGHRDEYYAWGFRNPWRLSFDGDRLFVGDVGQDLYEEVDLVEKGGNYGWNVKEGPHCFNRADLVTPLDSCPSETPPDVRGGEPLRDPILGYPHAAHTEGGIGTAVIGGYVYRRSALPGLTGRYVFGSLRPNGQLFVGVPPDGDWTTGSWHLRTVSLTEGATAELNMLLALERDEAGDLYALGAGGVHRIVLAS